jgi:hypothetical protein
VRSVEFHPEAEAELRQYFESHAENLGLDFILAVRRAYERILQFPDSWRPFGRRLRRTLVRGFPYGLLYRVEPSRILIVSLLHAGGAVGSSRPGLCERPAALRELAQGRGAPPEGVRSARERPESSGSTCGRA